MVNDPDYEKEWVKALLSGRYRFQKFSSKLNADLNEIISYICESLSLSAEIEFTCYVNVHSFFEAYWHKLQTIINTTTNNESIENKWEEALTSVKQKAILFIMNVIFICTKYVDNTIAISISVLLELLTKIYRPCEFNFFKQMEFQVLHLVDFQIQPPTTYYSALYHLQLCLAQMPTYSKNIYSTLKDILRIAFLRRKEIYDQIDPDTVMNFEEYRTDQTLLGIATVLTIFEMSKYPPNKNVEFLQFLSTTSNIPVQHITLLSTSIQTTINA